MPTRTAADLERRIREALQIFGAAVKFADGDPDSVNAPVTSIRAQINLTQSELLMLTRYAVVEQDVPLVSGTRDYTLTNPAGPVRSVWVGEKRLRRTTLTALDRRGYKWRTESGSPQSYYQTNLTAIGFYKKPNTYGDTAKVLVPIGVDDLEADTDTPEYLPPAFHDLLVEGTVLRVANIDSLTPDKRARMEAHQQRWERGIALLSAHIEHIWGVDDAAPVGFDQIAIPPTADENQETPRR